jgi:hypothetical protein
LVRFLVTSAGSANGGGHDAVLAFNAEGEFVGPFSDDPRIVDPRGLCIDPSGTLIYLNSVDRMLALDRSGSIVRDSGPMTDLDPGGAVAARRVPRRSRDVSMARTSPARRIRSW